MNKEEMLKETVLVKLLCHSIRFALASQTFKIMGEAAKSASMSFDEFTNQIDKLHLKWIL